MGLSRSTSDQRTLQPYRCVLAIDCAKLVLERTESAVRRTTLMSHYIGLATSQRDFVSSQREFVLSQRDFTSPERELPPDDSALVDDLGHLLSATAKVSSMRVDIAKHSLDVFRGRVRPSAASADLAPFISYLVTEYETLISDFREFAADTLGMTIAVLRYSPER